MKVMDKKIRTLIVDDHHLVRTGLQSLLLKRGTFEIVGDTDNGARAVDLATRLKPELVTMNIQMPVMNGIEATRMIKAQLPDTRVVLISASSDYHDVRAAIGCGADGYCLKSAIGDELISVLNTAVSGMAPIRPDGRPFRFSKAVCYLAPISLLQTPEVRIEDLTGDELKVLRLIAEGLSNRQIAGKLGISALSVRAQVNSTKEKLGASSRTQAVIIAIRNKLLD